jgi:uncharacterized protein
VNEKLPSAQKALNFLSDCGCSEHVIAHCKAVSALAVKFAEACKKRGHYIDVELVEVGALLHDIGRSKTHGINHSIVGVKIAESLDLPKSIVSIIGRHIGGGITAKEAKELGWPVKNYLPTTLEEKIVTYADKLIEGCRVVPIAKTLDKFAKELGENHPAIDRIIRLHEELVPLIGDSDADSHSS